MSIQFNLNANRSFILVVLIIILTGFITLLRWEVLAIPNFNFAPRTIESQQVQLIELTSGGRQQIGTLVNLKDITAAEAIRQRGGGQSQVRQLQTGYESLTVGELANRAAEGDEAAKTAIKIIKQADKKAQKYDGKQ